MQLQLVDGVSTILHEIGTPELKQKDIAQTYAMLILGNDRPVDFKAVNTAILERWSKSGLTAIKKAAWKIVEQKHEEAASADC